MKTESVKIKDLLNDPSNVRKHDERNIDAIKASLKRFGQQKPIVVDVKGIVVAGNGTLDAAKSLGWKEVQVVRTKLEGAEAIAYAVADNRTAELAIWDEDALAQTLAALHTDESIDELVTGFTQLDFDELCVPKEDVDLSDEWEGMPEFIQEDKTAHKRIVVHFKDEKTVKDFAEKMDVSITAKTQYIWLPKQETEYVQHKKYVSQENKKK
jgi:hypothetical protein